MLKRIVFIAMLALAAVRADAIEYTDVYYNPAESGWGFFLVQSDTTQFMALFIYGQDSRPTWYTGQLTEDVVGNYNGPLFATTGSYFAAPWLGGTVTPIGTISFQPTDLYHATLVYTVNGIGTITKTVQRQTLAQYVLSGNYSGSMSGSVTACTNPAGNDPAFRARYGLAVTQVGDFSTSLTFTFVDTNHAGVVCTVSGPLTHLGRLYQVNNAQFNCTGPGATPGTFVTTINSFHPTGQGIEGRITGDGGGGCVLSLHFAAVLDVNN